MTRGVGEMEGQLLSHGIISARSLGGGRGNGRRRGKGSGGKLEGWARHFHLL